MANASTDPHADLPVPDPGFVWATHEGVEGVARLAVTDPALVDRWTPVGPLNPADEAVITPQAGADTTKNEE